MENELLNVSVGYTLSLVGTVFVAAHLAIAFALVRIMFILEKATSSEALD